MQADLINVGLAFVEGIALSFPLYFTYIAYNFSGY